MSLGLRLGLSLGNGGGGSAPAGVLTQPYNYHLMSIGDSRTVQGNNYGGTYGTGAGIGQSGGLASGGSVAAFLGTLTGHKVRFASIFTNAGGGGQTVETILGYPRSSTGQSSNGTEDLSKVAANEAATVIMYMGTNGNALGPGGAARTAIQNAIAALTDPSVTWTPYGAPLPLYNGLPKNIILVNETPRGIAADGSSNLAAGNVALLEGWATWLLKFDYASGDALANPRVIAVDTFHDPSILDVSSGASYLPLPGLFADGLHPAPQGTYAIGGVVAARLSSLYTNASPFYSLATTSTPVSAAGVLNPNPTFQAGTPSTTVSMGGATLSSSLIPQGTTIASLGTGTGSTGTYHMSITASATATNITVTDSLGRSYTGSTTAGSDLLTITFGTGGGLTLGAPVSGAVLPANVEVLGSNLSGVNVEVTVNSIDATVGRELVLRATGSTPAGNPNLTVRQSVGSGVLNTIDMGATSTGLLRATVRVKYTIATANTVTGVFPYVTISTGGTPNNMISRGVFDGAPLGYGNVTAYRINAKNNYKDLSSSNYATLTTGTLTLSQSGLAAGTHPTILQNGVQVNLYASTAQDFTLYLSQMGANLVSD